MSMQARPKNYPPGLYGLPNMGEVIADHRIKAGWTSQKKFAIVCGVDAQTVVYWENQVYLADMERRIFLCKLLKIPPGLLGLTWHSFADHTTPNNPFANMAQLLEENAYGLYEDILTFANTSSSKYSPEAAYRFYKHQQELEQIIPQVPDLEKSVWQDLLSRFYQHSTFIAQHHKKDNEALAFANKAVLLAEDLHDTELLATALYRRSRISMIQKKYNAAKDDISSAGENVKSARSPLKGSVYLLAAEVHALYAEEDEKLRTQCQIWQDRATKLAYNVEDDGTFLTFDLYAVHHERAKTLLRFSLFHTNDDELIKQLKNVHITANKALLKDAQDALMAARKHVVPGRFTREMYLSITEARICLVAREYEACAKMATSALQFAHQSHSKQGIEDVKQLYFLLSQLEPKNPYVAHLGVELEIFPTN